MSKHTPMPAERLVGLADGYLLGELDADQLTELEHELNRSPASRALFAVVTDQATAMSEVFGNATEQLVAVDDEQSDDFFSILSALDTAEDTGLVDRTDELARRERARKEKVRRDAARSNRQLGPDPYRPLVIPTGWVWLGLAAAVGLAIWIGWPDAPQPESTSPPVVIDEPRPALETPVHVARLSGEVDASWGGTPPTAGRLASGQAFVLRDGLIQIEFNDGASVVVEGPSTFEALGANAIRLIEGRVAAAVPPQAHRFEVVTEHTRVIDLGSAFGVEVPHGSGELMLHVIEGEVSYQPVARAAGAVAPVPTRVSESTTLAIGADNVAREINLQTLFVRELPSRYESVVRGYEPIGYFRFSEAREDRVLDNSAGRPTWVGQYVNRVDRRLPGFDADAPGNGAQSFCVGFGSGRGSIRLPDPVHAQAPAGAYTYALWVKPQGLGEKQTVFLRTGARGPLLDCSSQISITPEGLIQHYLYATPDGLGDVLSPGQKRFSQLGYTVLTPGRWHHIVITASDNGEMRLYVDGEPDAAPVKLAGSLWREGSEYLLASESLSVGPDGEVVGNQTGFRGALDDLAMFDRVLTDREVQDIFRAGTGAVGPAP